MEKFAIIYDLDYTLTIKDSPCFSLFPRYGIEEENFWKKMEKYRKEENFEMILSYLYVLYKIAKEKGDPLTREILYNAGKDLEFYPGVLDWFDRINEFGKKHGYLIEHYIISSGAKETIEGSLIANKFKTIFATEYHYDENGYADWPLTSINYTNKTQYIFRINKGILNNADDNLLNGYMPAEKRSVHYKNMIYIGDGLTDVPCMKTMINKNGFAIAVYHGDDTLAKNLIKLNRCNAIAESDYRENSEIENIIKKRIVAVKNKNV